MTQTSRLIYHQIEEGYHIPSILSKFEFRVMNLSNSRLEFISKWQFFKSVLMANRLNHMHFKSKVYHYTVKKHEGKSYIWPDWTLGWFEHEVVKNWIRLRDRTLISVLERAGNETDENRNFDSLWNHIWLWKSLPNSKSISFLIHESFMWLKPASS